MQKVNYEKAMKRTKYWQVFIVATLFALLLCHPCNAEKYNPYGYTYGEQIERTERRERREKPERFNPWEEVRRKDLTTISDVIGKAKNDLNESLDTTKNVNTFANKFRDQLAAGIISGSALGGWGSPAAVANVPFTMLKVLNILTRSIKTLADSKTQNTQNKGGGGGGDMAKGRSISSGVVNGHTKDNGSISP